ncbi:MAG: hypothetical protein AB1589_41160 [Cyanobacteriota bacterium]
MSTIREIVFKVLQSGYLAVETEEQLRQMFAVRYDLADIEALTRLQQSVTTGLVKQQSREVVRERELVSSKY